MLKKYSHYHSLFFCMDILSQLFSSEPLIKIMRLFFLHPEEIFDLSTIASRIKVSEQKTRKEINHLKKVGFLTEGVKDVLSQEKKHAPAKKKKKIKGWKINHTFPFHRPLKNLVLNAAPVARGDLLRALKKSGKIQLVILGGFFLDIDDTNASRVDLLVVGDNIKRSVLDRIVRSLQAKIGKELNYTLLATKEFQYRRSMYDKFIRDILDYPHEKLLNKLGV